MKVHAVCVHIAEPRAYTEYTRGTFFAAFSHKMNKRTEGKSAEEAKKVIKLRTLSFRMCVCARL